MTKLSWDDVGERLYETGVDRGVLFIPNGSGIYDDGVAWNGLTTVTEKPSGADANPQFADNIKYLNLIAAEEFGATLEAFTYPDEFAQFDGLATPQPGIVVGQQSRKTFGLCYRTKLGNDLDGSDHGYKLHLVYGLQAAPSEKAYATINDSPEALSFSWELTSTPVSVTSLKPTSLIVVDSTVVGPTALAALELALYGDVGIDPALPLPDAVIALFAGSITEVTANAPTYVSGTHTITIVATTGVTYYNETLGTVYATGAHVITADTLIKARPNAGYQLTPGTDDDWFFDFV
jgi:hypothetical protein